jgi:hypothetical protein
LLRLLVLNPHFLVGTISQSLRQGVKYCLMVLVEFYLSPGLDSLLLQQNTSNPFNVASVSSQQIFGSFLMHGAYSASID